VFLFAAFFSALFVIWKRGREAHFEEETLFDVVFIMLFAMMIGGRIGYIMAHLNDFGLNLFEWFNVIGKPGFLYLPGLMAAVWSVWRSAQKHKWDVYALGDVLVVGAALAHALIALGGFFNGSGYGNPTNLIIGIEFPGLFDRRHPVQLYELVVYSGLFWFLWWVEGKYRTFSWYKGGKSEANTGFMASVYFLTEGFFGILFSIIRPTQMYWKQFHFEYLFYTLLIIFGAYIFIYRADIKWIQKIPLLRNKKSRKANLRNKLLLGKDIFES